MEAVYRDDDGTLYGWYHHEIYNYCPMDGDRYVGVPAIGAVVSKDNGRSFNDLGFVWMDGNTPNCDAKNGYFAGGNGDFSVILDREKKYFYFFFSAYGGPAEEQGVAVARMRFEIAPNRRGRFLSFSTTAWNSRDYTGE